MVSVASSSASMDLTTVVPALMQGIAQEVGVPLVGFPDFEGAARSCGVGLQEA